MIKKLLLLGVLILSGLVFLTGVAFVVMYAWNGVIARIGEADQSLVFWYLPVLIMGFITMSVGWAMGRRVLERLKDLYPPDD